MNPTKEKVLNHPIFKVIREVSSSENVQSYVVGGFVRDLYMGIKSSDIDITVLDDGPKFAQKVAEKLRVKNVTVFKTYGTAHFCYKNINVEFVGARKESYNRNSRNPQVTSASLEEDLKRRDLTINAIAISLSEYNFGETVDLFDGIKHIEKEIIQTPLEPDRTFQDDPLRMLRTIRFATRFDFKINIECLKSIKENSHRLSIITKERIAEEINKMLMTSKPSRALNLLYNCNLLPHILPELISLAGVETINGKSHKDNFIHTLEVVDNIALKSDNLWLRWAALLHDIAKPPTKKFDTNHGWTFHGHEDLGSKMVPKIFKNLKLPLDHKMKYVQKLVRLHLRPIALVRGTVSDSAVRRLLHDAGDDIDDLMTLCNADITSKNEFKVRKYKKNFELVNNKLQAVEQKDKVRNFQPPVSGELIMKTFNLSPCKEIGQIKAIIKESILDGKINNNEDEAFELMLSIGQKMGLIVSKGSSIKN